MSNHNKTLTEKDNTTTTTTTTANTSTTDIRQTNCNCRHKTTCPLNGQCLTSGVIYQATVTEQDSGKEETYTGITDNQFKTRFNNHNSTFRHSSKRNNTSLSNYIWTLKDKQIEYKIRWEIIAKCQSYSPSTDACNLCLRKNTQ